MTARLLLASSLLLAACSVDEVEPTTTDRSGDDVASLDGDMVPDSMDPSHEPGWIALMPGSSCATHSDCDSVEGAGDGYCYAGDVGGSLVFPPEGYCVIDDGTGAVCAVDDDCPGDSQCINMEGYRMCLPSCGPGGSCPAGQACFDNFGGFPIDAPSCLPGDATAVDGGACEGFYDCNASSECWNDIENPGGYCSAFGCTLGTNAGCHGGICVEFEEGPTTGTVCVEACASDTDCRLAEGYVCGAGGYCRHPHVGDACTVAADCGGGAWTCLTDGTESWPGGYCSQTGCPIPGQVGGCSPGSVCATVGTENVCVDRCPTIGTGDTCRGGYTCTAVGAMNGGGCLAE